MKRLFTTIAIIMLALAASAQSSGFAPIGSEWYYEYQDMYRRGYVHIEAVSDTLIDDVKCTKLVKTIHGYDGFLNYGLFSEFIGNEYVTQVNDSVRIYRNGAFHLLFDFGASVGDTWTLIGDNTCEQSYGLAHVVAVGTDTISGNVLKYVMILDDQGSSWGYCPIAHPFGEPLYPVKIVEKIGPIGSYLLPSQRCMYDESEGGSLRCYIDDDLGYNNFSPYHINCGYINDQYQSIDDIEEYQLLIYPNPCDDHVQIIINEEVSADVFLYDSNGKEVCRFSNVDKRLDIDMTKLNSGIYYLRVLDDKQRLSIKIIKK